MDDVVGCHDEDNPALETLKCVHKKLHALLNEVETCLCECGELDEDDEEVV